MIGKQQTAYATRCLWSLQEASPEIEGVILTFTTGLVLTSTFTGDDRTQRLAAISTTLYLLSAQATSAWAVGDSVEVSLHISGDDSPRTISLKPVGDSAVLITCLKPSSYLELIEQQISQATHYLERLLIGEIEQPPRFHQSR